MTKFNWAQQLNEEFLHRVGLPTSKLLSYKQFQYLLLRYNKISTEDIVSHYIEENFYGRIL
jgi:hypothetical protein